VSQAQAHRWIVAPESCENSELTRERLPGDGRQARSASVEQDPFADSAAATILELQLVAEQADKDLH
jgi:hypothetical protein